jgi:hypothetical protein
LEADGHRGSAVAAEPGGVSRGAVRPSVHPIRDHVGSMSDDPPDGVLGGLPPTRPHRRSAKRQVKPETASGTDDRAEPAPPPPSRGDSILGTAVRAAAELAEIGLMIGARALRGALSRLPRP